MIPGGVQYLDPRTANARWLDAHTFLPDRAGQVIKFRLANPTIYPERDWTQFPFVAQQIVDQNAERLNNDPQYFIDMPTTFATSPAPVEKVCPECNVALTEKICTTCSGRRVTGYRCLQCGKDFNK